MARIPRRGARNGSGIAIGATGQEARVIMAAGASGPIGEIGAGAPAAFCREVTRLTG